MKKLTKLLVVCLAMASMAVLAERSEQATKAPDGRGAKAAKRPHSRVRTELMAWAAKQDWFALSDTAEFGDLNRSEKAEKGLSFGYSTEFVDSKGKKHVLGIGLSKEPEQEAKRAKKKDLAEMCAQKNLMLHGNPVSTDASGTQNRSFSGTVSTTQVLSKTIVRPGTEEKWLLYVVRKAPTRKASAEKAQKKKDQ